MLKVLFFAAAFLATGSALAADMSGAYSPARVCQVSPDSNILDLEFDDLKAALTEYRDEAERLAADKAVIASNTPAFDWAIAAVVQCNAALGYLKGGHADEASSQKCDCFHSHMLSTL